MIQKVILPKLGETVEVSTIAKWLKQEGDAVAPGDILCEITTDKATLEVESYYRGTLLKIIAPVGKELPVGATIAVVGPAGSKVPPSWLAEAGAEAAAPSGEAATVAVEEPAVPAAARGTPLHGSMPAGRIFASPRARMRARELGVALEQVAGTGPGGRIVEADVMAVAGAGVAAAGAASAQVKASPLARKTARREGLDLAGVLGSGPGGRIMREDVLRSATEAARTPPAQSEVIALTAMRRIVAQRMLHSKQTIPCYYLEMEADVTDLVCLRNKLNLKSSGGKIGFNDFILRACGLVLRMFPTVNSEWTEGGIRRRGRAAVGMAVALDPEGLIVPVVRDPDSKPLRQIARESMDLAKRARSKKLTPDEYQGGSMTVSNLGMYGIKRFIPVVNPGESCILGLGAIQDAVVFRQGGIQVRKMMSLTLAVDHRLVDGAVGAQFIEAIRDMLEAPQRLAEEELKAQ